MTGMDRGSVHLFKRHYYPISEKNPPHYKDYKDSLYLDEKKNGYFLRGG